MKITDFKEGDLICRIKNPIKYMACPPPVGMGFMFSEIQNGMLYLLVIHNPFKEEDIEKADIREYELSDINDNFWAYFSIPKLVSLRIVNQIDIKSYKKELIQYIADNIFGKNK